MILFAIVLFVAMIAAWFFLPGSASTEALAHSGETSPLATPQKA